MRKLLTALFVALLVVGWGEDGKSGSDSPESNQSSAATSPAKTAEVAKIDLDDNETRNRIIAEAIDLGKLQERGKEGEKLACAPNQETPYSGWMKWMYDHGKIEGLSQLKDGKSDGLATGWNQNGQKESDLTFKNGKIVKAVAWKPNGTKCPGTNVVDGNGVRCSLQRVRATSYSGRPRRSHDLQGRHAQQRLTHPYRRTRNCISNAIHDINESP